MTAGELTQRYLSDTRSAHEAFERGIIDQVEHESFIERIDNEFFESLGFFPNCDVVERISHYVTPLYS